MTQSPFCSYAQNFEDVMLWRALKHVASGFYVDVGAQDPRFDSVSRGFYEQGWRGLHIEPNRQYAELLQSDRPDEPVIRTVLSDRAGVVRFYEVPDTGMSTCREDIALNVGRLGWKVAEAMVAAVTLDQIFDQLDRPDIHWLKIDVEGHEQAVLQGWRQSSCRPWIVVIESISPMTREENHFSWEPLLIDKDYRFVYFDGVNRYYLSQRHQDLIHHFAYGPCLWDEFQLPEGSRPVQSVVQRHREAFGRLQAAAQASADGYSDAIGKLESNVAELNQKLLGVSGVLTEYHVELGHARRELGAARMEREQSNRDLEGLRGERADLLERLMESRGAIRRTEDALDTALTERDRVKAELTRALNDDAALQIALAETRSQLARARSEVERLGNEMRHSGELWFSERTRLTTELRTMKATWWWRLGTPIRLVFGPRRASDAGGLPGSDGSTRPRTVHDLLQLDDEPFVRAAYRELLGRDADPDGMRHYLGRIRSGEARESVIAQIRLSREGLPRQPTIPGLQSLIRRYRLRRTPLLGTLLRLLERRTAREATRRRLAAIEARVDLMTVPHHVGNPSAPDDNSSARQSSRPDPAVVPDREAIAEGISGLEIIDAPVCFAQLAWRIGNAPDDEAGATLLRDALQRDLPDLGQRLENASIAEPADVNLVFDPWQTPASDASSTTVLVISRFCAIGYATEWVEQVNRAADGVVCASRLTRSELINAGVEVPIAAVGVGADHWDQVESSGNRWTFQKAFRFLHVSDCGSEQRVELLVESFGRAFERRDDVSLIIRPTGESPRRLRAFLDRLRTSNPEFPDVTVLDGTLDAAGLKGLFEQCQVFVALGRLEGFAAPVALALLSGLPVVATAWGGHLDYCDASNSWLVDYSFQYESEAEGLANVLAEPAAAGVEDALSMASRTTRTERAARAQCGRDTLLMRHSWSQVSRRMAAFVHTIRPDGSACA
jgi:FkbM family methyltransferase